MIKITKDEAMYLLGKGYKWHEDIVRTYSRYKKYYMAEKYKLLRDLNEYRGAKRNA